MTRSRVFTRLVLVPSWCIGTYVLVLLVAWVVALVAVARG